MVRYMKAAAFVMLLAFSLALVGCTKRQKRRAVIGGLIGGGIGAGIGAAAGGGTGAAIGAATGLVGGSVIGAASERKTSKRKAPIRRR